MSTVALLFVIAAPLYAAAFVYVFYVEPWLERRRGQ